MKLKVKNFRCYENAEFDFGDSGVTLLSGSSGAGKSTLLMAIEFALLGVGTKIISHGKKSCSVELSIGELKIVRTKGPNRLVVNDVYEDDAAESIIKESFGTSLSYIHQNMKKEFILMSPSERLDFLEKMTFSDVNISEIKARANENIKKMSDKYKKTIGNLEFATKMLEDADKPIPMKFPIQNTKLERSDVIKNEEVKYKNTCVMIKRTEKEIKLLENEMSDIKTLEAVLGEKDKMINDILQKLEGLYIEKDKILYIGDEKFKEIQEKLTITIRKNEHNRLKKIYEEDCERLTSLKTQELEENTRKLKDIETQLWTDIKKDEIDDQIEFWQTAVDKRKKLVLLSHERKRIKTMMGGDNSSEIESISQRIEDTAVMLINLKLRKECLQCPYCTQTVKLDSGKLIKVDINISVEADEIPQVESLLCSLKEKLDSFQSIQTKFKASQERVRVIENEIEEINTFLMETLGEDVNADAEVQVNTLREYKSENMSLEKIKTSISTFKFSSSIICLENKNNLDKCKLDKFDAISDQVDEDEDELRKVITKEARNLDKIRSIESNIKDIEKTVQVAKVGTDTIRYEHLQKYKKINSLDDIKKIIVEKESVTSSQLEKQSKTSATLKKIEEFKIYEKNLHDWSKLNRQKTDLETLVIEERKKYTSACVLKDKILQAESITIGNTIENINTHAHSYLEYFFPDTPINARLLAFKETKSESKPQINLEIDYKGMEYDLSMLSGGEVSRIILAFTLAIAEMRNSPIIMLDESTSSLDQDLTSSVVDGLKENFTNKLVILIAHQVVQGVFDRIIKLI